MTKLGLSPILKHREITVLKIQWVVTKVTPTKFYSNSSIHSTRIKLPSFSPFQIVFLLGVDSIRRINHERGSTNLLEYTIPVASGYLNNYELVNFMPHPQEGGGIQGI